MSLDTATNLFSWDISFSGLTAPDTAAHFPGPALPGVNAPVIINLINFGFPLGVTACTSTNSTTVTGTQEEEILAGLWYLNVHTTQFPGGEIHGQLVPVPASLLLLGSGLLGLGGWRGFGKA